MQHIFHSAEGETFSHIYKGPSGLKNIILTSSQRARMDIRLNNEIIATIFCPEWSQGFYPDIELDVGDEVHIDLTNCGPYGGEIYLSYIVETEAKVFKRQLESALG